MKNYFLPNQRSRILLFIMKHYTIKMNIIKCYLQYCPWIRTHLIFDKTLFFFETKCYIIFLLLLTLLYTVLVNVLIFCLLPWLSSGTIFIVVVTSCCIIFSCGLLPRRLELYTLPPPPTSVLDMTLNNLKVEVPVMLELWGMQSTPLLPTLPGPLWPGVIVPDMG